MTFPCYNQNIPIIGAIDDLPECLQFHSKALFYLPEVYNPCLRLEREIEFIRILLE